MTVTEKERGKARHPMIEFGEKVLEVLEQPSRSYDPRILKLSAEFCDAVTRLAWAETELELWDERKRLEEKAQSLYSILVEEDPTVQTTGHLSVVALLYRRMALAKAEGRTEKEELANCRREDEEWDDCHGDLMDELKAYGVWPWKTQVGLRLVTKTTESA